VSVPSRSRAQSEVVGIILLTAVIVILVAVAGGIFLSNAFDEDDEPLVSVESNVSSDRVSLSHSGGDTVDAADVEVVLQAADSTRRITLSDFDATDGGQFDPGSEWETSVTLPAGQVTLFVVHTPSDAVVHEATYVVE